MGFGKFFSSCFIGSMAGAGPNVFSVWGYVIANAVDGQVELNPIVLAAVIGMGEKDVAEAIEFLCAEDPNSRNPADGGKRLVKEGSFAYRVVSHDIYRAMRNEDARREYNRVKQKECRERKKRSAKTRSSKLAKNVKQVVNDMSTCQPRSAKTETETETEAETETETELPGPNGPSSTSGKADVVRGQVRELFEYWAKRMQKPGSARLTAGRRAKVEARLREGYSVEDIKAAIDGCARSKFHMGENDGGRVHNDLELICRSGSKLEGFRDGGSSVAVAETPEKIPRDVYRLLMKEIPEMLGKPGLTLNPRVRSEDTWYFRNVETNEEWEADISWAEVLRLAEKCKQRRSHAV